MSVKNLKNIMIGGVALTGLSACATQADPEPYLIYSCDELQALASPMTPLDPFAANRVGPDPQSGLTGDRAGLRQEDAEAAQKRDDQERAIRAAYRQKGCTG